MHIREKCYIFEILSIYKGLYFFNHVKIGLMFYALQKTILSPSLSRGLVLIFMRCGRDAVEVQSPAQGRNFAGSPSLLKSNPK